MRQLLRRVFFLFYRPFSIAVISRPRVHTYMGLTVQVPVGVFHPGLFFSTHFLVRQLSALPLKGRTFIEVGCGTGLISLAAARAGALVTAVDVNPLAVSVTQANFSANGLKGEVLLSNLFAKLHGRKFDVAVINPPYFKREPQNMADHAWMAGENLEYFTALFATLPQHLHHESTCLMVLSEDCAINEIKALAAANRLQLVERQRRMVWLEENYIFEIKPLV